jgi:pilus assembly protein CpaE
MGFMSNQAQAKLELNHDDLDDMVVADVEAAHASASNARPIPRISIQAFVETSGTSNAVQLAAEDRRLSKTHVSVHMGGASAAVAHYRESPTPNLIVIESSQAGNALIEELERLAEFCDAGTKVVVVGHINDVVLYRELLKRGVSEYIVAPVTAMGFMECLSSLYNTANAAPVGSVVAFIGAKGGVGSSTICHNTAWAMSEAMKSDVVVADLDLAFGTTGLDFNQDPTQGIAEALQSPERLDEVLLDRLLTKCSQHLSIFAAPVLLDRDYDVTADACDVVLDVVRQNVPHVAVDLPHIWTPWVKRVILQADEIVITAIPDLANLRNAKNMLDVIKANRGNDAPPRLVLNMTNMPKRPEISIKEFVAAIGVNPAQVFEFDAENFGQAGNNGQMVEEFNSKAKAAEQFRELALTLAHRRDLRVEKKVAASPLAPFLEKLKFKR